MNVNYVKAQCEYFVIILIFGSKRVTASLL